MRTSFARLEAFGRGALRRTDAEGLSRLQHVTRITLNQGEFAAAERWNAMLLQAARLQGDARYRAVV